MKLLEIFEHQAKSYSEITNSVRSDGSYHNHKNQEHPRNLSTYFEYIFFSIAQIHPKSGITR